MLINKRADSALFEVGVYTIFVIVFVAIMFLFINRVGSQNAVNEQIYAKQIALIIDKAKPGTEINLNVEALYKIAGKNNFNGRVVEIDNNENKVIIRLVNGKGYEFYFFNDVDVVWDLKDEWLYMNFAGGEDEYNKK